jgi:uncharacterized glyoxalase superfamily protein PhnB
MDMASIDYITLETADLTAAELFYKEAFGLSTQVRLQAGEPPTSGFRGFTVSLLVAQPSDAEALLQAALGAGATSLKPASKSMWGYGGVVQSPDGSIWKVATSKKKDTGPVSHDIEQIVLLLGVDDVSASKRFYADHGFAVGKSFGPMYAEFEMDSSPIKLALNRHKALAKDAGVSSEGSGSHRLIIGGDVGALSDPDGFAWQSA